MKKCAVCDQEYADEYDGCPHCARAQQPDGGPTAPPETQAPPAKKKNWVGCLLLAVAVVILACAINTCTGGDGEDETKDAAPIEQSAEEEPVDPAAQDYANEVAAIGTTTGDALSSIGEILSSDAVGVFTDDAVKMEVAGHMAVIRRDTERARELATTSCNFFGNLPIIPP